VFSAYTYPPQPRTLASDPRVAAQIAGELAALSATISGELQHVAATADAANHLSTWQRLEAMINQAQVNVLSLLIESRVGNALLATCFY
jgi:hypothetical protein